MAYKFDRNEAPRCSYLNVIEHLSTCGPEKVLSAAEHICQYEVFTNSRPFIEFDNSDAEAFGVWLLSQTDAATGLPMTSLAAKEAVADVRRFFEWLDDNPSYRSHIEQTHVGFLGKSLRNSRIAHVRVQPPWPTLEQARAAFEIMPDLALSQRRDRALFATLMITGIDPKLAILLRLKQMDMVEQRVFPHNSHSFEKPGNSRGISFLPAGAVFIDCLICWVIELLETHKFRPEDPLLPVVCEYPLDKDDWPPLAIPKRQNLSNTTVPRREIQGAFFESNLPMFRLENLSKIIALSRNNPIELTETQESILN